MTAVQTTSQAVRRMADPSGQDAIGCRTVPPHAGLQTVPASPTTLRQAGRPRGRGP
jgi:hypothetical protein